MLRRGRQGAGSSATVIELSIPMRLVRGSAAGQAALEDDDLTCYICANSVCATEQCCRTLTHLACCTQTICCGCLLKSSKRCGCKEDCDAVISLCPFCREVSPVEALDVFLGGKQPCAACVKADAGSTPAPSIATPPSADVMEQDTDEDIDETSG